MIIYPSCLGEFDWPQMGEFEVAIRAVFLIFVFQGGGLGFLPSGLRLAFILIFVVWGAVGVAIGSMLLCYFSQSDGNLVTSLGTGIVSGFAPLLARQVCIDFLKLGADLRNLSATILFKTSAVFAIFSALLHQLWYTWLGQTSNFIHSTLVMMMGDFLGTVIVLYASKFVLTTLLPTVGTGTR